MISQAMRSSRARTRVGIGPGLGSLVEPRAGDEGERHAVDLGILRLEHALVVGGVAHAAQAAADHLLAEQLRAEGAHAQDVGDGVGVPALGEHGDGDHALDLLAELAGLADGVHHLAQQVFVGEVFGVAAGEARAVLGLELLDLAGGDLLEVVAHRLAGFELLAVDQDGVGAAQSSRRPSSLLKMGSLPGHDDGRAVRQRLLPAGDVVEDQLGDVGVVADDDEDRRGDALGAGLGVLLPQAVILLVVAVEAVQRALQLDGQLGLAADGLGPAALLGQVLADAQPEVAVGGLVAGHRVVGHGHARHLDDAALDGVDQREVGDHPGEERAFGVAGAAQEERRGREVVDHLDADLGLDRFEAGNPDAGLFLALLGFLALVAGRASRPRRPACGGSSGGPRR